MTKRNLEQGPGGAGRQKPSGSHLDQAVGRNIEHPRNPNKGGKLDPAKEGRQDSGMNTHSTKDNLTPFKPTTNQPSPVKGGGTVIGHDRVAPNAGKAFSGSKFSAKNQAGSVGKELTTRHGAKAKQTYLGKS